MSNRSESQQGGLGIVGVLTIVFVVLKLTHNLAWSWVWVLSPLWISAALALAILVVLWIVALIQAARGVKQRNRNLSGR